MMASRSVGNSWKQLSFNLIKRSFSTSSNPSTAATVSKCKRKKKKNLFEVAEFLPNWGIGYQMAKTHWSGVAYQITKINLYKDGKHGKAWGIVHKDGESSDFSLF
ncbi:putative mitochondrial 28S ribosomal protein S34 [Helianthus annuus]|nr:putative mitochondrial 28S ribosomal protein S34 [Helianthus annuus]